MKAGENEGRREREREMEERDGNEGKREIDTDRERESRSFLVVGAAGGERWTPRPHRSHRPILFDRVRDLCIRTFFLSRARSYVHFNDGSLSLSLSLSLYLFISFFLFIIIIFLIDNFFPLEPARAWKPEQNNQTYLTCIKYLLW